MSACCVKELLWLGLFEGATLCSVLGAAPQSCVLSERLVCIVFRELSELIFSCFELLARYLFALQLKRDLLEERLSCAATTAALLTSHLLQG